MVNEKAPSTDDKPSPPPVPGFDQLGLSDVMMEALAQAEYHDPSPVQAGIIPHALTGGDLLGQARTGTGKTAAFAIPILERLELIPRGPLPNAIVLVPTRELAVQVRDEMAKLAYGRKTRCIAVYGGKPIRSQITQLEKGCDIVVGTPGRVLDHLARGTLKLNGLQCVVLDEADRMLDIGFRPDIEKICVSVRMSVKLCYSVRRSIKALKDSLISIWSSHRSWTSRRSPKQPTRSNSIILPSKKCASSTCCSN